MKKILVNQSQEEMISSAAGHFISTGTAAIDERGKFNVALAGGSTPIPLYEYLADQRADEFMIIVTRKAEINPFCDRRIRPSIDHIIPLYTAILGEYESSTDSAG